MICRYVRYRDAGLPAAEWVPMGLRDAVCALRRSDPEKWNDHLRAIGVEVHGSESACLQNLDGSWARCPLCEGRETPGSCVVDVPRNAYGFPLFL